MSPHVARRMRSRVVRVVKPRRRSGCCRNKAVGGNEVALRHAHGRARHARSSTRHQRTWGSLRARCAGRHATRADSDLLSTLADPDYAAQPSHTTARPGVFGQTITQPSSCRLTMRSDRDQTVPTRRSMSIHDPRSSQTLTPRILSDLSHITIHIVLTTT